jgi:hypothetical protein
MVVIWKNMKRARQKGGKCEKKQKKWKDKGEIYVKRTK